MSIFNELLPEIKEISNSYAKNFGIDLQKALEALDRFGEDYKNGRNRMRETIKSKTNALNTLQSINEDEVEANKPPSETKIPKKTSITENIPLITKATESVVNTNTENFQEAKSGVKRGKEMIDGPSSSPEMDKRQKRNASVKAHNLISKQVNVNLSQKMRRDDSVAENPDKRESRSRSKRNKDENKENSIPTLPVPIAQIKLEKLSLPPPVEICDDIPIKQEVKDELVMPPPVAPVPKPRRVKEKVEERERDGSDTNEEDSGRRRTRNKKQAVATQPRASSRSTRSTRGSTQVPATIQTEKVVHNEKVVVHNEKVVVQNEKVVQETKMVVEKETIQESKTTEPVVEPKSPEPRPKRTRTKRKQNEMEEEKKLEKDGSQDSAQSSPERSRPKRTRKAPQKFIDQIPPKEIEPPKPVANSPKPEKTVPEPPKSPILENNNKLNQKIVMTKEIEVQKQISRVTEVISTKETINTEIVSNGLNETMVLPNGKYDHLPTTPTVINMNATVVLERAARSTLILDKPNVVNETVVLESHGGSNVTEDDSIMTDDNSDVMRTPPPSTPPPHKPNNPSSAVKEKVQQFEEMASRVTRTKTRAMAKKDEDTETQTPPDKVIPKNVLSSETLAKMNNMIFNGKSTPLQSSQSATKASNPMVLSTTKTMSSSKLPIGNKYREAKEEEDPRKKKQLIIEQKTELAKRKREEKMAAAEAARSAAERHRLAALEAAEKERLERENTLLNGKLERKREAERHRQELARKLAETEERRKKAELMRNERHDEIKRADAERRRQLEEAERTKKEAARMAKEMEKRKKEYIEKQKLRQKLENDKVTTPLKQEYTSNIEPVYMADGFQHLNSDSEDENPKSYPVPAWSQSKVRYKTLLNQIHVRQSLIDRLFSIRTHSPDLRVIFPNIDARALKRTSSAVWRTPNSTEKK